MALMVRKTRPGLRARKRARRLPLVGCTISADWRDTGRARILVIREQPDRRFVVARFQVDVWCLGLVSADVCKDINAATLRTVREETYAGAALAVPCAARLAAGIIYGGIAYAERLGFAPHPGWSIAQHVLPAPPAAGRAESIEFGRDGKPCYVAGAAPDDEAVMDQLDQLGPDAYNVLLLG